ncbi:serine hydrolase [Amycolatopsis ultiminotia]|uniref:Serine hydrolase n=1 Tax=Amycolatopsis ultiminotia TaxID=543629 RepID=A0ABP6YLG1_9PSEU
MSALSDEIEAVFAAAGTQGFLHAREIGVPHGPEVSADADEPVVLASVFKIPVALAYAREVAAGRLDDTERTRATARYRVGGIGTAGCADDVEMSWRDLAHLILTMSDNAATDVLFHRIGQEAVERVLTDLGLCSTRLIGCCADLFASVATELGGGPDDDLEQLPAAATPEQLWKLSQLDPERTTSSTAREIATLLEAIRTDRAGDPAACERVRTIMAQQIRPRRLSSGFPPGVQIAAKTGTLPAIRNEAGMVTYVDGHRYAVAVFTRGGSLADRQPAVDSSLGAAARLAVEHLRAQTVNP